MKLSRKTLFLFLLTFVGLADYTILSNIQFLFLRQLLTFTMLLFVPGLLINLILKINKLHKFEYLLYMIGGSLVFLMLNGLFINWALPLLQINNPLSFNYVFTSITVSTLLLAVVAFMRNKNLQIQINYPKLKVSKALFYAVPISFPILSILGTNTLNNGGSNYLTMLMLGEIALYIGAITLFKNKIAKAIFPFTLFMVSLAVLLMLSLRSWYISGFDISIEYEVFKITLDKMHWAMENFKNEYNACLSITILPTILSILLNVKDAYIYKLFFQVVFAFTPVGIYLLVKKLNLNTIIAFLAGLFYICNPWFIDPMTTLNRQEIAFFFFILQLLLLFDKSQSAIKKYSLLAIFTVGLVVSHYSSTYITIILFTFAYIIGVIIKILRKLGVPSIGATYSLNIKLLFILFFVAVTYIWYSLINTSTTNLTDVMKNTYKNLPHIFNQNAKTAIIDQVLNAGKVSISKNVYQDYYSLISSQYSNKKLFDTYKHSLYKNYKVTPTKSPSIPIQNKHVYNVVNDIYKFTLVFIELSLIIGSIVLLFFRRFQKIDSNLLILIVVCEILLVIMATLPYISVGYNFDRLYMQDMFVLSIVEILGGIAIINLILKNRELSAKLLTLFYIIVFLFTYGFIWQIVGGKTVTWLNNFGYFYDQTYTHKSEYLSALWIGLLPGNPRIYTTSTGRNILAAYAHKNNVKTDLFPSTIETYAYVYVTTANLQEGIASFFYRGEHLEYVYPKNFIDQNKNLIYNNGGSEVYK